MVVFIFLRFRLIFFRFLRFCILVFVFLVSLFRFNNDDENGKTKVKTQAWESAGVVGEGWEAAPEQVTSLVSVLF